MRTFIFLGILCMLLVDVAVSLDQQRDCKCRIKSKKRIIGGREADPMAFPWVVSVQWKERDPVPDHLRHMVPEKTKLSMHFCGGNIITERWILTAAHCLSNDKIRREGFVVAYGSNDLVAVYEQKKYAEVEKFIRHPDYDILNSEDDLALILLKTPLNFTDAVQPACLPEHHQARYEGVLKIAGFGRTRHPIIDENGKRHNFDGPFRYLKEANIHDYSDDPQAKCERDVEICVENRETRENSCQGDSGGPLLYTKGGRSTVIGTTSHGFDYYDREGRQILCAGQKAFVRLSNYMNWIKRTVDNDVCV